MFDKSMFAILCAMLMLSHCGFADAVRATSVKKTVNTTPQKIEKAKVLSPMMEANAKEFAQLKKNLGVTDDELSRIDVLELITLAYAKMFDGLEARVVDLERRSLALETETRALRTDTEALQKQAKSFDEDLNKIFGWSDKIDDELHNNLSLSGINYEMRKLRQDVSSDLRNHSDAINKNAESVGGLWNSVNQNSNAIRELMNAIRSIR